MSRVHNYCLPCEEILWKLLIQFMPLYAMCMNSLPELRPTWGSHTRDVSVESSELRKSMHLCPHRNSVNFSAFIYRSDS